MTRLPIEDALPDLIDALRTRGRAVLQTPPGAGKTTRVPLAMLEAGLTDGKIIMLEPRRLAARAAANRMASILGEKVGETIERTRAMAGQAPYIVNAGFSYDQPESGMSAGLFYNVKGRTLEIVGGNLAPDIYTEPFHSLNFTFNKTCSVKFCYIYR